MDIVFCTAAIAPFRETPYAARSAAACAKALRQLGHRVTVVAPLLSDIDPTARHLARRLQRIEVEVGDTYTHFAIYEGKTSGGVDLVFLGHPDLLSATALEGTGPAAARSWGAFCRAAVQWMGRRDTVPEVIQLYGWQVAPIALVAKDDPALHEVATVLSVHQLDEAGVFDKSALSEFGIAPRYFAIDGVEFYGRFSALKAGIQTARAVVVPGPSFAKSLAEPGAAGGLDGAFRSRASRICGIVEGVDVSVWNAATDPHLKVRFDAAAESLVDRHVVDGQRGVSGKERCKTALVKSLDLPARADVPLLGYAGTLAQASLLEALVPKLVRADVQLAVFLEGEVPEGDADRWKALAARWPDRVAVRTDADTQLVHQLLGGADLVLVPGDDPCATRPMEAHRYGALPVAFRAGLAADTVVDCDAELRSGTGFLVDGGGPRDEAFLAGVQRGIAAFALGRAFRAAGHRAMLADHGWDRPARLHERLYRSLAGATGSAKDAPAPAAV